jgi:hypothetical protein
MSRKPALSARPAPQIGTEPVAGGPLSSEAMVVADPAELVG